MEEVHECMCDILINVGKRNGGATVSAGCYDRGWKKGSWDLVLDSVYPKEKRGSDACIWTVIVRLTQG